MLTLLVTTVALSLGADDGGKIAIINARPTYGYLGAPKPRSGALPGEISHFAFDIKGLKQDGNGRASYSVAVEVRNAKGEVVYEQKPYNRLAQNFFGGDTLPCAAHLEIPLDTPPGEYLFLVTIHDRLAKKEVKFQNKGKVLPLNFGLVQVGTFSDRQGNYPAPPVGAVGEALYVNFAFVGFDRRKDAGQPNLEVNLRILDDKGQPTMPQPLTGNVKSDVPAEAQLLPMHFGLTMNRTGRYTIELNARDHVSGKTAQVAFPVRIVSPE